MEHLNNNHGVRSRIPQAPWVLYFDGASRKPAASGAWGIVLKNNKGQIVAEERKFLGAGVSSGLAKCKALLAGLKKARGLHAKHLLAKSNSRILINQVVGRWTARDAQVREQVKKVWGMAREFESVFLECIPKDHNFHADRIANAALDKELQIQQVVSNYFDHGHGSSPRTEMPAPALPRPARTLQQQALPFSNLKLRPISPPHSHCSTNKDSSSAVFFSDVVVKGPLVGSAPLKRSIHRVTIASPSSTIPVVGGDDAHTSDSDLTSTIKSLTSNSKVDKFWADRLSISDEGSSSISASDEDGYFQPPPIKPEQTQETEEARPAAATQAARGCEDDSGDEDAGKEIEELQFCKSHRSAAAAVNAESPAAAATATLQLSEADCERLVEAVIERMKRTRLVNADDTSTALQLHPL